MKEALSEEGRIITAAEGAPQEAKCPACGHTVQLRRRRLMNNRGYSYYWRHKGGGNLACRHRSNSLNRGYKKRTMRDKRG